MGHLQDCLLIKAYEKAVELDLQADFIEMIESELEKRGLLVIK